MHDRYDACHVARNTCCTCLGVNEKKTWKAKIQRILAQKSRTAIKKREPKTGCGNALETIKNALCGERKIWFASMEM
jgi:hypothetical protein